jgi:predicted transcriptional regulator
METWMNENFQWLKNDGPNRGNAFLGGMQIGAQIAQSRRNYDLQVRKLISDQELAERDHEMKKETLGLRSRMFEVQQQGRLNTSEGLAALGETMSEIARTGRYTDPEAKAKFWATARKYPQVMQSAGFRQLLDVFDAADLAEAREELEKTRVQGRIEVNDAVETGRMQRLSERLDRMEQMKSGDQAFKLELEQLRHDLNVDRDAKRPHPSSDSRFDLSYSDQLSMKADLDAVRRAETLGLKPENAAKRREQIETKYHARRRTVPVPTSGTATNAPGISFDDFEKWKAGH